MQKHLIHVTCLFLLLLRLDSICAFSSHPYWQAILQRPPTTKHPLSPLQVFPGSEVAKLIDPDRAGYEMQAFEAYGTVTSLAINACLYLYVDYEASPAMEERDKKLLNSMFIGAAALCNISGVFTVLLFTLLVIFGQSALGKGNIEGFVLFWSQIDSFALVGFQSFLVCCGSLVASFLFSLKSKVDDDDVAGNIILAVSVILVLAGGAQIQSILSLATNLIFTPEIMRQ